MPPWIVIDFETRSLCNLKKAGSYRYAADPSTEVLCLAAETSRGERGIWIPGQGLPSFVFEAINDPQCVFVCHGAGFERNIWAEHMVKLFGWPPLPIARWHDTQARGRQLALPPALENILPALGLHSEKDMVGNKLTVGLSRPDRKGNLPEVTPAILDRVSLYCLSDITGQTELHKRIGWLPACERPIWELSQKANDRGIRLDMAFVRAAQSVVDQATVPLAAEFRQLTTCPEYPKGLGFGQIQKVRAWLHSRGVHLANLSKETLEELLGEEVDHEVDDLEDGPNDDGFDHGSVLPPDVERALKIRQLIGSASIKKLARMELCVGFDGRARGLLAYHGTSPGRQTGSLFQPHNFPRGTLEKGHKDPKLLKGAILSRDLATVARIGGKPPVEVVVSSLRHAVICDKDRILMAGDYAGIQARTVLALAGQHDKTALMAAGADIYCDMASQIYGFKVDKALHPAERQTGKNAVLGLGFYMGARKFQLKYAKDQSEEFCERVVTTYRKEWAPKVPALWRGFQDCVQYVAEGWDSYEVHERFGVTYRREDEWITAHVGGMPADCKLWYYMGPKARLVMKELPWSTEEKPAFVPQALSYASKGGRWITNELFGGQLTENVVMKIEREIIEHAKQELEKNGFPVVLDVHDEIICEPLKVNADLAAFTQIMEENIPQWARDMQIPIAVEAWEGEEYRK